MVGHCSGHSIVLGACKWEVQSSARQCLGNSSLSVAARVEARRKRTLKRVSTFVIRRHLLFVPRLAFVLPLQTAAAVVLCHRSFGLSPRPPLVTPSGRVPRRHVMTGTCPSWDLYQ